MPFEEFRSLVEHCRDEAMSNMADIRDAYKRFYRLCERYHHEDKAGVVSASEGAAFARCLERTSLSRAWAGFVELASTSRLEMSNCSTEIMSGLRSRLNHRLPPCLQHPACA